MLGREQGTVTPPGHYHPTDRAAPAHPKARSLSLSRARIPATHRPTERPSTL